MSKRASLLLLSFLMGRPLQAVMLIQSDKKPSDYQSVDVSEIQAELKWMESHPGADNAALSIARQSAFSHHATLLNVSGGTTQVIPALTVPAPASSSSSVPRLSAFSVQTPDASAIAPYSAAPFTNLDNVVDFIHHQQAAGGTLGLPLTFNVPPGTDFNGNSQRQDINTNGAGLYDTSLAIIALIEHGNMDDAGKILMAYAQPRYGDFQIRAYPTNDNRYAFDEFTNDTSYIFDFVRASGHWDSSWAFYDVRTGPNAWLALSIARYIDAARKAGKSIADLAPYITLGERLGDAMLLLQQDRTGDLADHGSTQGGIRYGPKSTSNDFDIINSENDVSAHAALLALSKTLSDVDAKRSADYQKGVDGIENWLQNSEVWVYDRASGQMVQQHGLLNPNTGLLYVGTVFNKKTGHWEVLPPYSATDSGGTWTISSLGANKIDQLWGAGTAYNMYMGVRHLTGRTVDQNEDGSQSMHNAADGERLDGLDFSDQYDASQGLISPEWSAGGIFSIQELVNYYRDGNGQGQLSDDQISQLLSDSDSIHNFISQSQNSTAYAVGPGLTGDRQGQTGWSWQAPPAGVDAMAAIYQAFGTDPLAWSRSL